MLVQQREQLQAKYNYFSSNSSKNKFSALIDKDKDGLISTGEILSMQDNDATQ